MDMNMFMASSTILTLALLSLFQEGVLSLLGRSIRSPLILNNFGNVNIPFRSIRNSQTAVFASKVLTTDVLVIGSGISGSTAAFYLTKEKRDVILADAKSEVGGNLLSRKGDGYLWEEGPNSFQPNVAILRLANDLGMTSQLVLADPSLPRFVYWDGKLYPLPSGLKDLINFDLLTWHAKLRAAIGAVGLIKSAPSYEETIQEWVTRHLGAETFERIIDPFVSGVYAGDPRKLSMKASLKKVKNLEDLGVTRGILDGAIMRINQISQEKKKYQFADDENLPRVPGGSLGSFRDGLQSIVLKIKERLGDDHVLLDHRLTYVTQDHDGWTGTFETPHGKTKVKCKALLLTSPAYATSEVLTPHVLPAAWELKKINYPPVASVTLAYPNDAFKISMVGFGNLIPRSMNIRTLGTIWSSSLFPDRAPPGYTLLLSYIGGSQDTQIINLSAEDIVHQVHLDVKKILLKDNAPKPTILGMRMWHRAIPQYELGHLELLDRIKEAEQHKPGLFLGGNYRSGIAFGDCVQFGSTVARDIAKYLSTNG